MRALLIMVIRKNYSTRGYPSRKKKKSLHYYNKGLEETRYWGTSEKKG